MKKTFDNALKDLEISVEINAGRVNKANLTKEAIIQIHDLIREYAPFKSQIPKKTNRPDIWVRYEIRNIAIDEFLKRIEK